MPHDHPPGWAHAHPPATPPRRPMGHVEPHGHNPGQGHHPGPPLGHAPRAGRDPGHGLGHGEAFGDGHTHGHGELQVDGHTHARTHAQALGDWSSHTHAQAAGHTHSPPAGQTSGYGHGHGQAHPAGHNHGPGHLHSHLPGADAAEALAALAAEFIDGFAKAADKMAYLRLAGVPLELAGEGGAPPLKLVDVQRTTEWQVGTASPAFGTRELNWLPFPGPMVQERTNMALVYVSLEARRLVDVRDFLRSHPALG